MKFIQSAGRSLCATAGALIPIFILANNLLGALEHPQEGRWSVATGWENEWPAEWQHADPMNKETVGEWSIYKGQIQLPQGVLLLRDSERIREDGITELKRRWEWTGNQPIDKVTLTIRKQWRADKTRPFLPGISYYDNPAGQSIDASRIPVIGNKPGSKGYFEEHRFPMPLVCWEGKGRDQSFQMVALHSLLGR